MVYQYSVNQVTVLVFPDEAIVEFRCNLSSFNGTVHASVTIYDRNGFPCCGQGGGVTGLFNNYNSANIILDGTWIYQ